MLVTLLGIMVFLLPAINVFVAVLIIALQLLRLSYIIFSFSTTIEVKLLQLLKALSPILMTLLGIVMEVKLLQLLKALSPILMTLLGIVIEVKPVQ